jgi:hypothetical protein
MRASLLLTKKTQPKAKPAAAKVSSAVPLQRLLVIFGMRGTLLERIHARDIPVGMPENPIQVNLHKVWLRPNVTQILEELSEHCDLAVWSSTTARNTGPVMEAAFPSRKTFDFKFVWTREHTSADSFRRIGASEKEDEHATIKDVARVTATFPKYSLDRIVLVDDTPSKARVHADNFLWLKSCRTQDILDAVPLANAKTFILNELVPAKDVRDLLPKRF